PVVAHGDDAGQGAEPVVQPDRVVEDVLRAAGFRLVERLLDRGQLLLDRPGRVQDLTGLREVLEAFAERRELFADAAEAFHGPVRLGQLAAAGEEEAELLLEVVRPDLDARVGPPLERNGPPLPAEPEPNLVLPRNRPRSLQAAAPEDQPREGFGAGV